MQRITFILLVIGIGLYVSPVLSIDFVFSTEEGFNLGATQFNKYDIISTNGAGTYTAMVSSLSAVLPQNVGIDALQYYAPNNLIFSIGEDAVILGYQCYKRDLLGWDGANISLIWDGSALPPQVNLDAVNIVSLSPLEFGFSLAEGANLPGIGQVHKSDIIRYLAGSGFTWKYFDAMDRGLPAQSNLDAVMQTGDWRWALSFDAETLVPTSTDTRFGKSDLVDYDVAGFTFSTTPLFIASANGIPPQVNLNAISPFPHGTNYLNTYGSFTVSDDSSHWFFEIYADGTDKGILTWQSTYAGRTGVMQVFQTPSQKGKLSQIFSVPSTGWYTVIAKVATDIPSTSPQQKVYLYLYQLGADLLPDVSVNEVIAQAKGGLGEAGIWRDMTVSFYAAGTMLSVQVVGINPASSGVSGNIYFDEVWVYAGALQPASNVTVTNPNFDSDISGWSLEKYADGIGPGTWSWISNWSAHSGVMQAYQDAGYKGKESQLLNMPNAGHDSYVSVWVFSGAGASNLSQKVYLYLYSYDGGYANIIESGNVILGSGRWTPGEWRLLQFTCKPLTIYNAAQIVGINPAGRPTQSIYFDEVVIKQD
jgi:hypothetical protein